MFEVEPAEKRNRDDTGAKVLAQNDHTSVTRVARCVTVHVLPQFSGNFNYACIKLQLSPLNILTTAVSLL